MIKKAEIKVLLIDVQESFCGRRRLRSVCTERAVLS